MVNGTGPEGEVGVGETVGVGRIVDVGEALEAIGVEVPVWRGGEVLL